MKTVSFELSVPNIDDPSGPRQEHVVKMMIDEVDVMRFINILNTFFHAASGCIVNFLDDDYEKPVVVGGEG